MFRLLVMIMVLAGVHEQISSEILKEQLFASAPLISAKISPDGKTSAYVGADEAGISNVFIGRMADPVQITFFKTPDIDAPILLVVAPHGGPFKARDKFEFNLWHQWLAGCGYAVLSVNFRLSSGLGKAFVNAGNGQWGGKAHDDVIDAVECCISKGITEYGKLAVFGGSYGGYEVLV
jgi:hypothetical protein